ncbi:hypothetical protein EKO04_002870 [Ascochyta lentis]|uniref:Uncharacterized protein n=1 Tax=Ascochyta lentis TaxID=205686 RepID=A0A8H7MKX4_9PLEO|nr:hypothetical protein EKO04_002870 [Ascochyta lentis]
MKIVTIVAALAATFDSALADVICNSEVVHYKPRMISVAEKDGFADAVNEICSNAGETLVQKQFESIVFSRTRTADTFNKEACMSGLQSIVEECVAGKNAGGGSLVTNDLTVEIHLDSAIEEKRATKPKPLAPSPKPKAVPAKPTPAAPKPGKKPPTGKACPLKPGKGKGTGSDKGKGSKNVRDLISKLLPRAGSSGRPSTDYGDCPDPEKMDDGGAWGVDTWRGMKISSSTTMTNKALRDIAKAAYAEVMLKKKTGGLVIAALFVPGHGVFIGSPAHGSGPAKVKSFAEANAKFLWKKLDTRKWNGVGSKYHAEDIAMLYAIETGAVSGDTKFPAGSKIAAWGKVGTMTKDDKMKPCSQGNINPGCSATIRDMDIDSAYDD